MWGSNISLKDGVTVATIVPQHAENGSLLERDLDLDFGFDYFRNYTDQTSIDQSSLSPVDAGIMAVSKLVNCLSTIHESMIFCSPLEPR